MIVPVTGLDALNRCRLDLHAYQDLLGEGFPPLVYLFCRETRSPGNDISARFFFEAHGVREDPATGNGAAFLANYLVAHKVFPAAKRSWRIEQGYAVRRPSLVQIRALEAASGIRVDVGGGVIEVLRGTLA